MKLQLVLFFTASLLSTVYSAESIEYCYHKPECYDPSTWATRYPQHCNGTHQSPINIVTADVKDDSSLTDFSLTGFNDSSAIINIMNLGNTVQVQLDSAKMNVSGGGLQYQYQSLQFHIHWGNGSSNGGSEHTVDGKQYAMEMHIVNKAASPADNDSMKFAVLGFFIEATNDNGTPASWKNLSSFLTTISTSGATMDIMDAFTINSLIEGVNLTNYYRYLGSLTTPTCDEVVVWTLFKDPIKVSSDLIDLFSNTVHINLTTDPFLVNNFRPVQNLNDRVVSSQPKSTTTTTTTTTTTSSQTTSSAIHHTLSSSKLLLYSVLFFCVFFSTKTNL